jgi:hypothetical protein
MAGTPMLVAFAVDVTNPKVKEFGRRVAASARLQGGAKYHVFSPPKGGGDDLEGHVFYVWFPDGPESADVLRQGRDPQAAADLIKLAKDANITHANLRFGKQRMHRIAEHNRDATSPPAALVVYGVKIDTTGNTQNVKAGLKLLHQQVISKNPAVRYAAHKLGDGEHGFLVAGADSVDKLTTPKGQHARGQQHKGALFDGDNATDDVLREQLRNLLPGAVKTEKATYKTVLTYNREFSNP